MLRVSIKTNSIKRFIPFTCTAIFFHNSGVWSRTTMLYLLKRRIHRQFNYKEKETNRSRQVTSKTMWQIRSALIANSYMVKGCHMNHATPWTIRDLNPGSPRYERGALTNWANGPEREDSFRSIPKLLQFLATSCNKGSLRLSADRREWGWWGSNPRHSD